MIEHLITGDACSIGALYRHPLVEAVLGGSLHPGGVALTREMVAGAKLSPGARILEVGCGKGESSVALAQAGHHVTALDADPVMAERTGRRGEAMAGSQGQKDASPVGSVSAHALVDLDAWPADFDAVLSECTLCLMDTPEASLAALARRLRPGGVLLLSDVTVEAPAKAFRTAAGFAACLGGALPKADVTAAIEAAGLVVEASKDRPELIGALRDRIHARLDVEALRPLAGPTLMALVDEAEAAYAAGHLSYGVWRARRPMDAS